MKKLFVFAAAVFFVGATVAPAHAGVLLEPYLGYATGDSEYFNGIKMVTEDASGLVYGARVGYSTLGLAFGAEYQGGAIDIDVKTNDKAKTSDIGVFVGYTFPVMLRVFGTYFFQSKADYESDEAQAEGELSGSAMKVGVGYTGLPLVAINLEYYMGKFDEFDDKALEKDTKVNVIMLSVSLPFTF